MTDLSIFFLSITSAISLLLQFHELSIDVRLNLSDSKEVQHFRVCSKTYEFRWLLKMNKSNKTLLTNRFLWKPYQWSNQPADADKQTDNVNC